MIVVFAILLHKAPESIGFGTFMLSNNVSRQQMLTNLLMYSFSAPVAAMLSFLSLRFFSEGGPAVSTLVAYLLIYACGTLIYVVLMQIMPEVFEQTHHYGNILPSDFHKHGDHHHEAHDHQTGEIEHYHSSVISNMASHSPIQQLRSTTLQCQTDCEVSSCELNKIKQEQPKPVPRFWLLGSFFGGFLFPSLLYLLH